MMAFWLSVPVLVVGFAASVVISLVQIVTSIQDATFNTVPRLAAVLVALIVSMPDAAESDDIHDCFVGGPSAGMHADPFLSPHSMRSCWCWRGFRELLSSSPCRVSPAHLNPSVLCFRSL